MKIELKDISLSNKIPNAFIAFLYINDTKAGIARNPGGDHLTVYHHINEQGKQLIDLAELHCKTLLPDKSPLAGKERVQEMELRCYIDKLVKTAPRNNLKKERGKKRKP